MPKANKPTDGRLKANRDFTTFMQRAVYLPHMRGDFKNDPSVSRPAVARMKDATRIEDFTDADLCWLLHGAMRAQGVQPFSAAENILAHLRERIERRERQGGN